MFKHSRRAFLRGGAGAAAYAALAGRAEAARPPNVVMVITDDHGYGDLSLHGNDKLKTPNLDGIARAGVQFTQFHVSPVCSPTRSSLMTGRYNYRTGVVDTFAGRSMMYPDEVTLAEMLGGAGYRTGIFGKWHLGDNYPLRGIDQGFQESLVHKGGGLAQPSGPPGNGYFDPVLYRNGKTEKVKGYCTDVFTSAALEFIEKNRNQPFFAYLATNAPHEPLQVDESYVAPFRGLGLDDTAAKVYAMVANIDQNVGRLRAKLEELRLAQDTILIFLTDNGPQRPRYNAGMRGTKGTVYEGGIRVPCFFQWPRMVRAGGKIDRIAAHIDILPTLLEACGVPKPAGRALDGRSLMPLIRGDKRAWPDRNLFFQWHRGDQPEAFRNAAVRNQRYKLVDGKELYDLEADPGEQKDIGAKRPEMVAEMRKAYEEWFRDVSSTRGYAPPRIVLGTAHENPSTLTRQDWRAGWQPGDIGHWEVEFARAGDYEVTITMPALPDAGEVQLRLNEAVFRQRAEKGSMQTAFAKLPLQAGKATLEAFAVVGEKRTGAHYVAVKRW